MHSKKIFKIFTVIYFIFIALQVAAVIYLAYFSGNAAGAADANSDTPKWIPPDPKILKDIPFGEIRCGSDKICEIPWIADTINFIYKYALGAVGIVGAVAMMAGGLTWLMAGGNPGQVNKAKDIITGGLTGIVLAFTSYLILYTISPALTKLNPIRVIMVSKAPEYRPYANNVTCSWSSNACNTDLGYTVGEKSQCSGGSDNGGCPPETPNCEATLLNCCCATSPNNGCSWSSDSTCGHNAQRVASYSECGTNTTSQSTCCCNWSENAVASGDVKKLSECIEQIDPAGSYFGVLGDSSLSPSQYSQCCDPSKKGTCAGGHHAYNSCHYGCNNGYVPQAVDWFWPKGDQSSICNVVKAAIDCGATSNGNIWGPSNMCWDGSKFLVSGKEPGHDTHLHISLSSCGH